MRLIAAAAVATALCAASVAGAPGAVPAAAADAAAAARHLQQAAEALAGPGGLAGAGSMTLDYRGELRWLNQGRTPGEPMRFGYGQQTHFDWAEGQLLVRVDFRRPESSFQRRAAFAEESGGSDVISLASFSPAAVVREMLADPRNLVLLDSRDGARVAGMLHERLVTLSLGADGLPEHLTYAIDDELIGDAVRRVDYLDYVERGGWRVPRRVRESDGGRVTHDLTLVSFTARSGRPDWAEGLEPAEAASLAGGAEAVELALGIHLVRRLGGQDYHAMLVELEDGLMLLETPAAIGDGEELRRIAGSLSPKPILYAVPTHHHDDHSAGAAAIARMGAAILTTPGNVDFFTRMARAPRLLAGWGAAEEEPEVRALAPGERIGPVRFLDTGSAGHAAEHLVFWLPDHGILFHSDMGRFNPDGSVEPARPQTCALLAYIEAQELPVVRIVGGHGRPGTMEDLRRSAGMEGSPCAGAPGRP